MKKYVLFTFFLIDVCKSKPYVRDLKHRKIKANIDILRIILFLYIHKRNVVSKKHISKIQDEFNTSTNTNTFPIYNLDHPIHPPPANEELDFKLSRLKRSIFSILRKHKKIPQNLSSSQQHNHENLYIYP